MKIYCIFEDGKLDYCFENKAKAHLIARDKKEYWERWSPRNKIPVREYEVRAFTDESSTLQERTI